MFAFKGRLPIVRPEEPRGKNTWKEFSILLKDTFGSLCTSAISSLSQYISGWKGCEGDTGGDEDEIPNHVMLVAGSGGSSNIDDVEIVDLVSVLPIVTKVLNPYGQISICLYCQMYAPSDS